MRPPAVALAIALIVGLAGCGGSGSRPGAQHLASTPPPATGLGAASTGTRFTDWPTYHRTNSRSGHTTGNLATPLTRAWSAQLDGAVYGEAIVAHGLVIAATENDSVYGLRPTTGKVSWHQHLGTAQPRSGLPCGDIDPMGITGTPAYDRRTGSVFVVAETTGGHHTLWALNTRTGGRRWHRSLDVERDRNRKAEQQRSALLVTAHRVITAFGGLAGDCDNYVGYVTSVPTSGHGGTTSYAVPTAREAGIWSPPGAVVGPNGNVYVATGNGAETGGRWDKSDSVTELTPTGMHRVAIFAPGSWAQDNEQDLDLGSSSPVPVNGRIVIAGKRGTVYELRNSLGGIGKSIARVHSCKAFGGAARAGHTLIMPCKGEDALRALRVGRSSLHLAWTASGVYGSPAIVGHRVYVPDLDSGDLKVLSLTTGRVLHSVPVGSLTHFPSVTIDGHLAFVPTLSGVTAIR